MAQGQVRSADVVYTFKDVPPQHAFRLGDECFVPLDVLFQWGWNYTRQPDSVTVNAEGHTVHMDLRYVAGGYAIAMRKTIAQLGGITSWTTGTDVLNVCSPLTTINVQGGHVHVEGGLNFKAVTSYMSPGVEVIDLVGAALTDSTQKNLPAGAEINQYRPNVVRLSVPTGFVPRSPDPGPASTQFDYDIQKDPDLSVRQDWNHSNPPPPPPSPGPQASQPMNVVVERDNGRMASLQVHVGGSLNGPVMVNRTDSLTLELTFPGSPKLSVPSAALSSPSISSVTTSPTNNGTILSLHLTHPVLSEVFNQRDGVTITLRERPTGTGSLVGKLVVIDPGHGGHDRGAHTGDVNEKDLTLPIATKVARDFEAAGATVILTRSDDTFIPLLDRSGISNSHHADLFISCHINSTGGAPTQSGTITFYHKNNQVGMYLAQCIQREIAQVNGLPDLGIWSDTKIYGSGFSVLRNTSAPCVLIEMGFINQTKDRNRMLTSDFQDSVAAAVVRGARTFFVEPMPSASRTPATAIKPKYVAPAPSNLPVGQDQSPSATGR